MLHAVLKSSSQWQLKEFRKYIIHGGNDLISIIHLMHLYTEHDTPNKI